METIQKKYLPINFYMKNWSNNPVKDLIVENARDYLYSSARNYADMDGLPDVNVLGTKPMI